MDNLYVLLYTSFPNVFMFLFPNVRLVFPVFVRVFIVFPIQYLFVMIHYDTYLYSLLHTFSIIRYNTSFLTFFDFQTLNFGF